MLEILSVEYIFKVKVMALLTELAGNRFRVSALSSQLVDAFLADIGFARLDEVQLIALGVKGTRTHLADEGHLLGAEVLGRSVRFHI